MGAGILRVTALCGMALFATGPIGCGKKIEVDENYTDIKLGDVRATSFQGLPNDITVTVEFTSTKADVTVAVFKAADVPILENASATRAIEKKTGKQGVFTAEVPKDTPFKIIVLEPNGNTEVRVKARSKNK
jgi:hypothetical protein